MAKIEVVESNLFNAWVFKKNNHQKGSKLG